MSNDVNTNLLILKIDYSGIMYAGQRYMLIIWVGIIGKALYLTNEWMRYSICYLKLKKAIICIQKSNRKL